jgi:hypothetical protein
VDHTIRGGRRVRGMMRCVEREGDGRMNEHVGRHGKGRRTDGERRWGWDDTTLSERVSDWMVQCAARHQATADNEINKQQLKTPLLTLYTTDGDDGVVQCIVNMQCCYYHCSVWDDERRRTEGGGGGGEHSRTWYRTAVLVSLSCSSPLLQRDHIDRSIAVHQPELLTPFTRSPSSPH